jgi:hypothetical protein
MGFLVIRIDDSRALARQPVLGVTEHFKKTDYDKL